MRSFFFGVVLLTSAPVLAQGTQSKETESIAALERAYQAVPLPGILLNIASVYAGWEGHCQDSLDTYQRFFEACDKCESLAEGVRRFDLTIEKCVVSIDDEIAVREKLSVPRSREPRQVPGDATLREVFDLIRDCRSVDSQAAVSLLSRLAIVSSGKNVSVRVLNELRDKAWGILMKNNASEDQLFALLRRLKKVDLETSDRLMNHFLTQLRDPDQSGTTRVLNQIRGEAYAALQARSSGVRSPKVVRAGCTPNDKREWGFVTIDTSPWSEVFMNGERLGSTPVFKAEALAGCVTIRAVSGAGSEIVKNVTVRPNKNAILSIDLSSGTDRLRYELVRSE